MRTLEKIFPGLFAAIGIALAATWFALVITGAANMLIHIIFLFTVAFIFEIYSNNQQYEAEKNRKKRDKEDVEQLLSQLKEEEPEEMIEEHEEEYHL
ncbi:MAG: hypothetical protein KDD06_02715 [Phaeodactylibacter sp.]|nr:hypothetical protein [Phaeodactylibacter sp.]MCB9290182.1 hypothetical protein [Lewinellaceae bacterium]